MPRTLGVPPLDGKGQAASGGKRRAGVRGLLRDAGDLARVPHRCEDGARAGMGVGEQCVCACGVEVQREEE